MFTVLGPVERLLNCSGASGIFKKLYLPHRPRSGTGGLGNEGVYGAGMDAIEEDTKEDEAWRGSCQFSGAIRQKAEFHTNSDIMEAMQTDKDETTVEEMDYDKEPVCHGF